MQPNSQRHAGLARAAAAGLVEVTEMGVRDWRYLDALGPGGGVKFYADGAHGRGSSTPACCRPS